jgi:hypothetical protein
MYLLIALYNLHLCRWYVESVANTSQAKRADALQNIVYYYSTIISGVCSVLQYSIIISGVCSVLQMGIIYAKLTCTFTIV